MRALRSSTPTAPLTTKMHASDQGVRASSAYYYKWKTYPHSAHYSYRQSQLGICVGGSWGCYAHAHPWIEVYSHDDGTSYWEGHT